MSPQKPRDFGMLVSLASTVGLPSADTTRTEVGITSVRYTSIFIFSQTFLLPFPIYFCIVYEYPVEVILLCLGKGCMP